MIIIPEKLISEIEDKLKIKVIKTEELGKGEYNINYVLNTSKDKLVLRIYANTQFDNAEKEFKILQKLQGKFAPKALYFDSSKKFIEYNYMIQEYIEGKTLNEFTEIDLKELANILKEIHNTTDNRKKRKPQLISDWCKNIILKKSNLMDENIHKKIMKLYQEVIRKTNAIRPIIKKIQKSAPNP